MGNMGLIIWRRAGVNHPNPSFRTVRTGGVISFSIASGLVSASDASTTYATPTPVGWRKAGFHCIKSATYWATRQSR